VQEELIQRADEAQRLRHLQVERAQYEADLAQRRYLKVDPDNRLVARVLEAEWNAKLRELEEARALEEHYAQTDQHRVNAQEQTEISEVPARFRQFWQDPQTTARQRKRAVRLPLRRCDCPQSRGNCGAHSFQRRCHPDPYRGAPATLCSTAA
jgi:hypothetical protein